MNLSEKKRNSVIYRKKINIDINSYYNNIKDNISLNQITDDIHMITEDKKNITQNNNNKNKKSQNYNFQKLKANKTNNLSLAYKKALPFYKLENINKNKDLIQKRNYKKKIKEKLLLNIVKSNKNNMNYLTDSNKVINSEMNYTDKDYNTMNNLNILNKKNRVKKYIKSYYQNTEEELNEFMDYSNEFISEKEKYNNKLRKISYESYINNSIFIKKKAKDNCLRNKSNIDKEKNFFEENFNNKIANRSRNIYLDNSPEYNLSDNVNKRSINNNNININISINNNYLTEDKNNNFERHNYKINKSNKLKDKNRIMGKTFNKNKSNKKLIKEATHRPKLRKKSSNKKNKNMNISYNKELKSINNNIDIYDNDNLLNNKLYNLEDFLLIIQKFETIKDKFNTFSNNINKYNSKQLLEYINKIRIKIYDLYEFYMSCSIEGTPQNLFTSKISKNCLHYYSVVLLLSIGLSYIITQKIKTTMDYHGKLLILLNLQEKAFMIFCDAVIKKLNDNYQRNIWVIQIIKKLNNQLISNADTVNHILQIKMLSTDSYKIINDILININIFYEKNAANELETFLYTYFHNRDFNYLTQFNINELEEIFDKNIFRAINLRSNYANITSLKHSNKDNNKDNNKNMKKFNSRNNKNSPQSLFDDCKINKNKIRAPYLNFPPIKEYTLVLDLDETMVSFKFTEISMGIGKLHLRPGLEEFLEEIKNYYEIIVFTSGTKDYADTILKIIEQKNDSKYFNGLLYREHTTLIGKKYIKDLSKIGRDLSKTIIVDNLPQSFKLQRENGILINSFYGDNMEDKALYELKRILINIYNDKNDVRDSIIKYKEDIIQNVTCIDEEVYTNKNE